MHEHHCIGCETPIVGCTCDQVDRDDVICPDCYKYILAHADELRALDNELRGVQGRA